MAQTLDLTDTKRALVQHALSGEQYVVEYCSVWDGDQCIGSRIIRASEPVYHRDINSEGGPLEPSAEVFARIDQWQIDDTGDADWLQAEEDTGRLKYPIGVW